VSCPYEGANVPTLLDVVHGLGPNLGKVVLVEMGYNDDAATFAQNVEASIAALLRGGAQRILWANLRGFSQHWIDMNDVLDEAAHRHPELTIVDWDSYSSNRWSWFQGDGIHLVYEGAMAMATLFNSAIRQALAAPATVAETPAPLAVDTPALPAARVGHAYLARLVATGGSAPYRWRVVGGSLPKGLSLRPDGRIDGVPKRTGRVSIVVRASDAQGREATRLETLRVASAS
jgi:hypothetical protein